MRIAVIGAGSVVFTKGMLCELALSPELRDVTVALMDIDPERLRNTKLLAEKIFAQAGSNIAVEATEDRREALDGADYVVNVTMIGGLTCRHIDYDVPARYGLKQSIGCTMGPGGVMSGLRSIPFMLDVASEMQSLCPDAVMLNYHNPQSATAQVWDALTNLRYVGLCHGTRVTTWQLARYIGCEDASELECYVAGINHMAWFLKMRWKGEDAYPILRERIKDPEIYWKDNVRFEVMRNFGLFCTESTDHTSEYLPFFRRTDDMIERNRLTVKTYANRLQDHVDEYAEKMAADLDPATEIKLQKHDESTIGIIRALETGKPYRFPVNVVNDGLIDNLPAEAVVEVPGTFDRNGVHPDKIGRLPEQLAALCMTNLNVQQLMAHAVMQKSTELAIQAVMLDPLTASVLELDKIREMMRELIEAEAKWLPDWVHA